MILIFMGEPGKRMDGGKKYTQKEKHKAGTGPKFGAEN